MELAKKPVRFLCKADAVTLRISVPKTEHHYLFYRNQPYLVKFDLDIEFFDEHLMFDRIVESEQPVSPSESAEDIVDTVENTPEENVENPDANGEEESPGEATQEERLSYSRKELKKMRKSDIRDILKKLAPEKSSPVRKENIIKEVLKAQESK